MGSDLGFQWLFCISLMLLHTLSAYGTIQNRPPTLTVGAIVDLNSVVGKVCKQAMELALNDINADSSLLNASKIILQVIDSNSNALQGSAAAVQLLKQGAVSIAGPQSSLVAHFVAAIAGVSQIPLVSFAATDPALSQDQYPYFFRILPDDAAQMAAVASIVHHFRWREVLVLYSNDEYRANGVTALDDALNKVGSRILFKTALTPGINTTDIRNALYQLSKMKSQIFIVHASEDIGLRLLAQANALGILSQGYAWIVTESIVAALNRANLDSSILKSIQGLVGVRSYISNSPRRHDFETEWGKYQAGQATPTQLNVYGIYAYDSLWMIAHALESFLNQGGTFEFENSTNEPAIPLGDSELAELKMLKGGPQLREQVLQTKFNGTSGLVQLDMKGDLIGSAFEIVNFVGQKPVAIGYWMNDTGITNSLPNNRAIDLIPPSTELLGNNRLNIVWPGGAKDVPRRWALTETGKPLRIAVPRKLDYLQILGISNAGNKWAFQGFCIEVFKAALKRLPYEVPYNFIPFGDGKSNPNYTDMIRLLADKKVDAVVGDVTIRTARLELADFTQPYKDSGLVVVIQAKEDVNSNPFNFLRPFTPAMWGITGAFFIFTGVVIWILEHKVNPEFEGSPKVQIVTFLWFSFSTLFFGQRENTKSFLGRCVVIMWLFIVLIITSAYTANLTSILTVQQLTPTIQGISSLQASSVPIGYQAGSFVRDYLLSIKIAPSRLKAYSTMESLALALSLGPEKGGVAALVEELPYVQVFLSSHCGFTIAGQEFTRGGWGFAFRKGSELAVDISTAILSLSESGELQKLNDFWLKKSVCVPKKQELPDQIGLKSFWGAFVITGVTSIICLIVYVARMLCNYNKKGNSLTEANLNTSFFKYLVEPVKEDTDVGKNQRKRKQPEEIVELP